jgi:phosphatidate cytidylyltransferase
LAQPAPRRSLLHAIATTVVLLGLVGIAYLLGRRALFVLIAIVVLVALVELLQALRRAGGRPVSQWGAVGGLGALAAAYGGRDRWLVGAMAASALGSFLLALRPARGATPAADVAWTVLAVTWIGGGGAAAVYLMRIAPGGPALLIATLLVVASDDILAYFVGSRVGRHKMAPSISPAKSWEGFAGGFAGALLAGALAGALVVELDWFQGLGLGLVCAALTPAGDLAESLVKREIGIKDSGSLLPGHGGVLDRIDAVLFCAPAVLVYLRLLGA